MSSPKGRNTRKWPWFEKAVIQCCGNRLIRENRGLSKKGNPTEKALAEEFYKIIPPAVLEERLGYGNNDHPIHDRWDKGRRTGPKYEHEHPDKHPIGVLFIQVAQEVYEKGHPLAVDDIVTIEQKILSGGTPIKVEELPPEKVESEKTPGYVYIAKCDLGKNCKLGKTKRHPIDRLSDYRSGDLVGGLDVHYAVLLETMEEASRLEAILKKMLEPIHLGNERYEAFPSTAEDLLCRVCLRHRFFRREIQGEELRFKAT